MDQHRFATSFESRIKPAIAKELGLRSLKQSRNVDYATKNGNLIELKLRKVDYNVSSDGVAINKSQYEKISKKYLGNRMLFDNELYKEPTFSYMAICYQSDSKVSSIKKVEEAISNMHHLKIFLFDHSFVEENDCSGKSSRFYRVLINNLQEATRENMNTRLLGKDVSVNLVGEQKYIRDMALSLFGS